MYMETPYVIRSIYRLVTVIRFVIDATASPQQVKIQTTLLPFVVDHSVALFEMLWIRCRLSICCRFVIDSVAQHGVQQIYNKSNKMEFELNGV